jgi:hypothetical protein
MPEIGTAAATNSSGIAPSRKGPCDAAMSTKSRHVIYGSRIAGAKISARMMPMRANIELHDQQQGFHRSLPIRRRVFGKPGNVGASVFEGYKLLAFWRQDRAIEFPRPAALSDAWHRRHLSSRSAAVAGYPRRSDYIRGRGYRHRRTGTRAGLPKATQDVFADPAAVLAMSALHAPKISISPC